MKASSSRRGLLKGLAALSAAGAPAVAAAATAAEPDPDTALLTLAADYFRALAVYRAAGDEDQRLRDICKTSRPPEPDALRRAGDFRHFRSLAAHPEGLPFYTHGEVVGLRAYRPHDHLHTKAHKAAIARAQEIVAAYDRWQEEVEAHADTCGLTAAAARCDEADDVRSAIGAAVKAARPTTLAGFIAKARVGQVEDWPEFDAALREDLAAMAGSA